MKIPWDKLGAKIGIGVCLAGFLLLFLGWNGAASVDRIEAQLPYVISGGLAGLALVVVGAALIIVETSREDRQRLHDDLHELQEALGRTRGAAASAKTRTVRSVAPGQFVAGEWSYHRPDCRLLEGRGELPRVTTKDVARKGLVACRVCRPAADRTR